MKLVYTFKWNLTYHLKFPVNQGDQQITRPLWITRIVWRFYGKDTVE